METKAEIWLQQDFKLILKEKLGIFKPWPYIFICFGVIHTYSFGPVDRVSWQPRHICKGCTVIDDVFFSDRLFRSRRRLVLKSHERWVIAGKRWRKSLVFTKRSCQQESVSKVGWIFNSFWQSATGTTHIWLDLRDFSLSETYKTDLVV